MPGENNWTVLTLLKKAESFFREKGIPSARLEAEILLAHVLGFDRVKLYTDFSRPVIPEEQDRYRALIMRRARGEPTAYLTGHKEFFSLDFQVTPHVLIPRPETEEMVQAALDRIPDSGDGMRMADVGTGSGCIPVTLLKQRPGLSAVALDLMPEALEVASRNAELHGVTNRVRFLEGHLLEPLGSDRMDLITCNPPYVDPRGEQPVDPDVKAFEPGRALFTPPGDPGFYYRELLDQAAPCLKPEGFLLLELGAGLRQEVESLALERGFSAKEVRSDLAGIERVMVLELIL